MGSQKTFSLFFIFLILVSLGIPVVSGANNTTKEKTKEKSTPVMKIDKLTTLVSWNYDSEKEQFSVTLKSDLRQSIVFSNVFSGAQGDGQVSRIPQQQLVLDQGKQTVKFDVTEYRGKAILGLATPRASINIVSEGGSMLFSGAPRWVDVQASAIAGLLVGGIIPIGYAFVIKYKEPSEPRRKL
ncbi:hypothetical protein C9439_02210 [archaeon SCG-AAA382B04]|nr:hypothetical protein C9439_02210 [archaeon SCG-AAA382B04]